MLVILFIVFLDSHTKCTNNSVRDYLELPDDGGEIPKSQGKLLAVRIPAVKSPMCLTENSPGGQLPPVLWRWPVGLLSKKPNKKYRLVIVVSSTHNVAKPQSYQGLKLLLSDTKFMITVNSMLIHHGLQEK